MNPLLRRISPGLVLSLVVLSCLAFAAGLIFPLFTVRPAAGEWTPVMRLFAAAQLQEQTYTLPGGIMQLWREGETFLALLLGMLSIVLPVVKLSVLWWEWLPGCGVSAAWMRFFRIVSRYAMVEVFVIALLVILIKGLPGGSQITLHLGTWAFSASVILSLIASQIELRK